MTWTFFDKVCEIQPFLALLISFSFSNISFRHVFQTVFGIAWLHLRWTLLLFFTCMSPCVLLSHVPALLLSLSVLRLSFEVDDSGEGGRGFTRRVSEAAAAYDSSRGRRDLRRLFLLLLLLLLQMGAGIPQLLDGLRQNLQNKHQREREKSKLFYSLYHHGWFDTSLAKLHGMSALNTHMTLLIHLFIKFSDFLKPNWFVCLVHMEKMIWKSNFGHHNCAVLIFQHWLH